MNNWKKYFTIKIITENYNQYEVSVEVTVAHDSNYGADADGHRGVPMDFIDDVNILSVYDIYDNRYLYGFEITDDIQELVEIELEEQDLRPEYECDDLGIDE